MSAVRRSAALAAPLLCLTLLTACGDADSDDATSGAEDAARGAGQSAPDQAVLHTSEGDIEVALFPDETPVTVDNFAGLADGTKEWDGQENGEPLYDGTVFHRVIDGFMVQGGSPDGTGAGGPGYQFEDETDTDRTFDEPYLLAMANSGPNTNGSQFFITVEPTPHLDGLHTIFGAVTDEESQGVVDAIATTETGPDDQPVADVVLESVTLS